MVSVNNNGNGIGQEEENETTETRVQIPLHISASQRGLINNENPQISSLELSTSVAALPDTPMSWFFKIGSLAASPCLKFRMLSDGRDEISRSVASSSSHGLRERLSGAFAQKIVWGTLWILCKEWIRNPMNMALVVWIVCVAVSGAILFLTMTGMLNNVLTNKSQRNAWVEVNNQILNALFTLMCLYQHPKRSFHLILICRWKPEDISRLRKIYCKNGTYKPHEWAHMMVVIVLLHINIFAQYALCGLILGYKRSERPAIGIGICSAISAPAFAGIYSILCPLGRDYDAEIDDEEAQVTITTSGPNQLKLKSLQQKRYSFVLRDDQRIAEGRPQWRGGILDFWDDISMAYLSLFCSFCVFGWNMERLGFGNMFVHIATFLLFCTAPFWIFTLAAINIDNDAVREALVVTGIILCAFGLLYGGFWRIQMRKRFNLPTSNFCCGQPAVTDCAMWFFCCWCSLAQEVRTANFYDIVEDKFYIKETAVGDQLLPISPLPREGKAEEFEFSSGAVTPTGNTRSPTKIMTANSSSPSRFSREHCSPMVAEDSSIRGKDETMTPPAPSFIERDVDLKNPISNSL